MSNSRSQLRNRLRPRIERLELRQLLAVDLLPGLADSQQQMKALIGHTESEIEFQVGQESVELVSNPSRITVGVKPGAEVQLPSDLRFVRDITPNVRVYESLSPITSELVSNIQSIAGVDFTTSVFVNSESNNEAVLLNEIIVALQSNTSADDFFAGRPEFSSFRPLDGTSDQFIATVRAGYGKATLDVGNAIASVPGVAWTSPNFYQTWEKAYSPNDPRLNNQWHLNNTGQGGGVVDADSDLPEAWDVIPGGSSSLVVAIIDDGVQSTHPDLNIWVNPGETPGDGVDNDNNGWIDDVNGWNFVFDTRNSEPLGADRHGTAVAGVAAARGDNLLGVAGAAYRAQVMSLKMFDGNFVASDANIAGALYYAAGRTKNGLGTWKSADIVNNSWGGGGISNAINTALTWGTTLGRQGLGATYFFSSGNGFSSVVGYPSSQSAVTPGVISIGATNNFAQRSNYSNFGTDLDIVTPSNDTRSGFLAIDTTDRTSSDGYSTDDYTGTGSTGFGGTSSAAPLASGIATLVLSRAIELNEPMSPALLRSYLRSTTDLFGGYVFDINSGKNFEVGYGRLNAATAVKGIGIPEISMVSTTAEIPSGGLQNFGSVNLGKSASLAYRVRNQGTRPLTIASNSITGPFFIDAGIAGATIGVGESRTIRIRFSPTAPGVQNGLLTINSNDTDEAAFVVDLVGTAISTAVSGEFYEDFAGDMVRATSDIPITEAGFAYVDANLSTTYDAGETRAFTDSTGYYAFLTLPIGTHVIRGSIPGWISSGPASGSQTVTITSPTDFNVGKDLGFAKNGRMYGFVFEDINRNGAVNAGENGVPGHLAFLDRNGNGALDPTTNYASLGAVPIPDLMTVVSPINVPDSFLIEDINVTVRITHTFMGDLRLTLISPTGIRVTLASFVGGSDTGYLGTIFDDEALDSIYAGSFPYTGPFIPDSPLSQFDGLLATGIWGLEASDLVGADAGSIVSWSMSISGIEVGRVSNAEGYVGIDLPPGNSQVKVIPTGSWNYTLPANGVRNVTQTPAPLRNVNFGLFFNNLPPTNLNLSATTVVENTPVGTLIGTLSTADPNANDFFNYSLVAGTGSDDNASFRLVGNRLFTNTTIDFETKPVMKVRIRTTDSGALPFERSFDINVTDVNEQGTSITLSGNTLAENVLPGFLIGNLGSDDPDGNDSIEFRFVSSGTVTDNGLFQIVGTRLESAVTFDKEARDNYSIRIRASDRFGLAVERVFVINVTNVNENPTDISISNDLMTESVNVGTSVGTFAAVDPDSGDSQTFSLVSGIGSDDNSKFLIVGNDLRTAAPLDFETQRLLSIRVRATDQIGLTFEKTFVISLLNINERPTDIVLNPNSVNEGSAIGSRVGDLMAIDQDLIDGHRLEFVDTANFPDSNFFRIAGSEVRTLAVFDFDTKNSYVTRVRATDQGGLTFEKNVTILVSNINEAPSDIGLDNRSIAENMVSGTLVGNLSTVDLDGNDTFTYSLVTGAGSVDNSRFTISGNQLRSANTFDFELAQRYLIRVQSRDSGGVAIQRTFTISVNNVNEPPVSLAMTGNSIPEDAVVGAQVGTLSTQDPDVGDSFGYSLVAGAGDQDNAKFSIVGNSLRTNASLNFEQASGLSVRIRSTDSGGLQVERQLAVSVTDVNEAPVNLRLTSNLIENTPVGSVIATAAADDIDQNDGLTYSFAPGAGSADNAQFTISPQGIIRNSQSIDFESKPSYNVRVRATDNAGLFVENTFVLNVTNINEAPTSINLSSNMVNENEVPGVAVGQFTTVDPDLSDAFSYALVAGTGSDDNAQFVLVGNELRTTSSLNFESKASYTVRVRATDLGGAPIEQAFEILVKDLNESPTGMLLSNATIVESAPVGSLVGLLSTQDVDTPEAFQYALVGGAGSDDNAAFAISNNRLVSDSVFDFESKSSYSIRVRSTDRGNLFTESVFLIQILDGNDVPTNFNLSASVVNENEPAGVLIGLLSAQDSDGSDTIKFRFVAGNNDNTAFALGGVNSERLLTSSPLNFEAKSEYRVDVQAFDNSGDGPIRTFVISVQNLNEAPSNLLLSSSTLDENQPAGSLLGTFSSADEDLADSHQYQLVGGTGSTDNNKFSIVGNALRLLDSANFEAQSNYSIRVRSTDAGGLMVERILAISINDIAESPFALQLSNSSINENLGSNVTIGALSASDPDIGTVLTYALVGGAGSDDNGLFQISGSNLVATQSLNFEEAATRQVRIRATDGSGLFVDGTFTIVVNNLAETPTSIALTNTTITENRPAGTLVGLVSTVDPDAADSHVYSFAPNGNVGDKFEFVGNRLVSKARLNFEAQSSYQLTIRSTDLAGLFVDVAFVVQVLDVVELPANAVADNATTQTSREVIIDVLRNDVDPDGTIDPTTVFIVTPPTEGTARVLTDGRIEFTPPADKRATFTFSYRVRDNDAVESNVGNVSIQVYSAFQNQRRQLDVDNDGDITPLDVLAIINDINVFGVRTLPTNVPDTLPFVDTNGNGQSDPLDVLEVVNYLNLISGGAGEGETLSIAQPSSDLDAAIAMLALEDVSKRDHAQAVDASMLYLDDYYSDLVSTKNRRR